MGPNKRKFQKLPESSIDLRGWYWVFSWFVNGLFFPVKRERACLFIIYLLLRYLVRRERDFGCSFHSNYKWPWFVKGPIYFPWNVILNPPPLLLTNGILESVSKTVTIFSLSQIKQPLKFRPELLRRFRFLVTMICVLPNTSQSPNPVVLSNRSMQAFPLALSKRFKFASKTTFQRRV